jgi:hypothetical protein
MPPLYVRLTQHVARHTQSHPVTSRSCSHIRLLGSESRLRNLGSYVLGRSYCFMCPPLAATRFVQRRVGSTIVERTGRCSGRSRTRLDTFLGRPSTGGFLLHHSGPDQKNVVPLSLRIDQPGAIRSHHTPVVGAEAWSMGMRRRLLLMGFPSARRQECRRSLPPSALGISTLFVTDTRFSAVICPALICNQPP